MSGYSKGFRRANRDAVAAARKSGEPYIMTRLPRPTGIEYFIQPEGVPHVGEIVAKAFPSGYAVRAATAPAEGKSDE